MLTALAALLLLAADPGWSASFPSPAVASYIEGTNRGVLVAGSGGALSGVVDASQALQAALRASDRMRLVMDDAGLGDIATAGDAQIVQRASALPVEVILVVRVFPGPAGRPPMAVATLYDKAGAAQGAFSVERGALLPMRVGASVGAGVPQAALNAVEQATGKAEVVDSKQQAYDHSKLTFNESPERRGRGWRLPGRGKYGGSRLSGSEFYDLVGRPDLASGFRARKGAKVATLAVGIAATVGGAVTLGVVGLSKALDSDYNRPTLGILEERDRALIAGGVAAGAGVLLIITSAVIPAHTIGGKQARELVDQYNQKLRKDYGLPEGQASIGGFVTKGGGGLTLGVTL